MTHDMTHDIETPQALCGAGTALLLALLHAAEHLALPDADRIRHELSVLMRPQPAQPGEEPAEP